MYILKTAKNNISDGTYTDQVKTHAKT